MNRRLPWLMARSRRRSYPLFGAAFAAGAPLGLLLLHAAMDGEVLSATWMLREVSADPVTYLYVTVATVLVFAVLGYVLGGSCDRIEARSLTDPLTGLSNRRHFDARLHEELGRAFRHHAPLSLLLIDLDQMKAINDRYGHHAGDEALKHVARVMRATCRRSDVAARYGGDEFALLAPSTTTNAAVALAERIREAVSSEQQPRVTVSIGVAGLESIGALAPNQLLQVADEALYRSKTAGRNRVSACAPEPRRALAEPGHILPHSVL